MFKKLFGWLGYGKPKLTPTEKYQLFRLEDLFEKIDNGELGPRIIDIDNNEAAYLELKMTLTYDEFNRWVEPLHGYRTFLVPFTVGSISPGKAEFIHIFGETFVRLDIFKALPGTIKLNTATYECVHSGRMALTIAESVLGETVFITNPKVFSGWMNFNGF